MSSLSLIATFHGNVRVGTGHASNGLDEVIDRDLPLGVGAVKGILRDEARWLLPGKGEGDHLFVDSVFGSTSIECPWNFDVSIAKEPKYQNRPNLRLDSEGSVVNGALLVKEEATVETARVELFKRARLSSQGLPNNLQSETEACHLALIHLAARSVEKMGQRRSRGLGWVAFNLDPALGDPVQRLKTDLDLLWEIRNGGAQ